MKKTIVCLIILLCSVSFKAEAFSVGQDVLPLFYRTADVLVDRVTDFTQYVVMQKKYLFNHFSDPNSYLGWSDIAQFETSFPVATSNPSLPSAPIVVPPTVIPEVKKPVYTSAPVVPPKTVKYQTAPPTPILISTPTPAVREVPAANVTTTGILKYTNQQRTNKSLEPLVGNAVLNKIAELRVQDLFDNQYFEHESPAGKSAPDLAKRQGYEYLLIGENLALGDFNGDKGIVEAWMDSPGHRANILNNRYAELGVAQSVGDFDGRDVTIAVQIFGQPVNTCAKPNAATQTLVISSTKTIKDMQAKAKVMYDNLAEIKTDPALDVSYYNQKIQEYNYFARNINDAVSALKIMAEQYNLQVNQYNACIS